MPIPPIGSPTPVVSPESGISAAPAPPARGASFAEHLRDALETLMDTQQQADREALRVAAGDLSNLHQAAIAMEEAKLTLQLAVQVRNKIVEAYQEISRMQV
ncbi:MAG: flagellar hook-basal body complex protein FliE [Abditibacteriales bacterium]|nr:flagellar hook-basal body complex protein FliE [Abditibacteriales bacterium]